MLKRISNTVIEPVPQEEQHRIARMNRMTLRQALKEQKKNNPKCSRVKRLFFPSSGSNGNRRDWRISGVDPSRTIPSYKETSSPGQANKPKSCSVFPKNPGEQNSAYRMSTAEKTPSICQGNLKITLITATDSCSLSVFLQGHFWHLVV